MTGIYKNNGRLRVNLSFAKKSQFRSKKPFSQPLRNQFRSCEMNVTVLRSGTHVPKSLLQLRNTLRNGTFVAKSGIFTPYAAKWHSCAKLAFAASKIFAEEKIELRNDFAKDGRFRRETSIPQRFF